MNFVLEENGQVIMVDEPQEIVVQDMSPQSPATITELAPIRVKKQKRKEPLKIRPMSEVEICIEVEEPEAEKNHISRQYRTKKNATPVIKEKVEKVKKDKKDVKTINLDFKDTPKKLKGDEKLEAPDKETCLKFDKDPPAKKDKETTKKDKDLAKKEKLNIKKDIREVKEPKEPREPKELKDPKDTPSEDNKDTPSSDDDHPRKLGLRRFRKKRQFYY